jgi:hypothetical protein
VSIQERWTFKGAKMETIAQHENKKIRWIETKKPSLNNPYNKTYRALLA